MKSRGPNGSLLNGDSFILSCLCDWTSLMGIKCFFHRIVEIDTAIPIAEIDTSIRKNCSDISHFFGMISSRTFKGQFE